MQRLNPSFVQSQTQRLSPRQQHAVKLLQMSTQDFADVISTLLAENPFLENLDDDTPAPPRDDWSDIRSRSAGTHDLDITAFAAVQPSLVQHLTGQLHAMRLPSNRAVLAELIIGCLDDNGYLRSTFEELEDLLPNDPLTAPRPTEWVTALQVVQSLEPLGVGARNLIECLEIQLQECTDSNERMLAVEMVRNHLPRVAANDIRGIASRMGVSMAKASATAQLIKRLDPKPGDKIAPARTEYVVPDVVAARSRAGWRVRLNDAVIPRIRVNPLYASAAQASDQTSPAILEHIRDASWTVRNIEQRFSTICEVARSIVTHQQGFFEHGPLAMKPLMLATVAEDVGVHESTVSRVTNNKYMATPYGVMELKKFFARPVQLSNGGVCAPAAVRKLIATFIEEESASAPLSDPDITQRLHQQGIHVARRTVTKYRQALRIPQQDGRKQSA